MNNLLSLEFFEHPVYSVLSVFRPCLRTEYHCLTYLIEILDNFLEIERDKILDLPASLQMQTTITFAVSYFYFFHRHGLF